MPSGSLDRLYQNPGSVQRRALVAVLESHGWRLVRRSQGHDVSARTGWPEVVAVPARLKGAGTIRRIIRQIQIEEASRE